MARKAKKKVHKMPPLSFVDKLIYWTILLVLCAVSSALIFVPFYVQRVIAFADDTVIAMQGGAAWHVITWGAFTLGTLLPWGHFYQARRPIFGRRNFKYGPPAWPQVYPVFMKNKPFVFVSNRQKVAQKRVVTAVVVILLISLIPLLFSFYGRECLRNDGSIVKYNALNQQTLNFSADEMEEIRIETYYHRSKNSLGYYSVRMTFRTNSGKKFTFEQNEFHKYLTSNFSDSLVKMLSLKQRYRPAIFRYDGIDQLNNVIAYHSLSEEDARFLYQLFDQPNP